MSNATGPKAIKETQRNNWNAAASRWEKWDAWLQRQARPVTDWLCQAAQLQPGHRVLDVGCGSGEPAITAACLVRPGGSVTAIDLAPNMLALAARRASEAGVENIEFLEMDAEQLRLDGERFDAATCRWGLMFCPDPARAAREVLRLLKPGAHFVLVVWADADSNPYFSLPGRIAGQLLPASPPEPDAISPLRLADPERLRSILSDAGFDAVRVEPLELFMEFDSLDHYWENASEFAAPVEAALERLSAEQAEDLKGRLLTEASRYLERGRVRVPATALGAYGRR